jgi:sugar lactone lactonase YvrE
MDAPPIAPSVMDASRVEVAVAASHELGEGALWDERAGAFVYVDI